MKVKKIIGIVVGVLAVASVTGLAITGWKINWGPFSFLHTWQGDVDEIKETYDDSRKNEIVFYGASNFSLWDQLDEDLKDAGFTVQNHAFGGSTDADLMEFADQILYPYEPSVIVLQTGSNDYVHLSGTDEEKVAKCMENKKEMYATFHEKLPDAKIVIMSGLLLPGRSEYTKMTQMINKELQQYADETDYLYYVDAEAMTYDGQDYRTDLFRKDGIHLNHEGELLWCKDYIVPMLQQIQ